MKFWAILAVLVGIGSVLGATGCGSGTGSAVSQSSTVSQSSHLAEVRFKKRLNDLCEGHLARQAVANEKFSLAYRRSHGTVGEPVTHGEMEGQLLEVIVPNVVRYIGEMEELHAPPRDQAKFEKLLAALRDGVKAAEADQSWIIHDQPEPFRPARTLGTSLGNEHCGQP
jgi:hypothetical protein